MAVTTDSGDNRQPAAAAGSGNRLIRVIRSRFDHCPVESKNFLPYQYQTMLYEIAKNKNTIICMSTGTGKTFIAIMLLKELSYQIRSDDPFDPNSSSGPKRSVFLVPTRPLVYQHAKSIREQSDLIVLALTGDDKPEEWGRSEWIDKFAGCHVAVMTAQIFSDILTHSFLSMSKFNLIVFDECHHAMHNHPYNCVMNHYDVCEDKPRILGLTASLITRKVKPEMIRQDILTLTHNLKSDIETSCDVKSINKYATNPIEDVRYYYPSPQLDPDSQNVLEDVNKMLTDLKKFLANVKVEARDRSAMDHTVRPLVAILTTIDELGLWSAKEVAVLYSKELAERIALHRSASSLMTNLTQASKTAIDYAIRKLQQILEQENSKLDQMLRHTSPKMMLLLQTLLTFKPPSPEEQENKRSFCGIVFVQKRSDTRVITQWLNELVAIAPETYGFLSVNYVTGQASVSGGVSASSQRQEEVLSKFRKHEYNLLIATSVLEEGLDITRCNVVIRFDFPKTVREYVQSKGRCRAENGRFILFCPSEPVLKERVEKELADFREIESILKSYSHDHNREDGGEANATVDELISKQYVYKTNSGAVVSLNSAISIVNRYCIKLPSDSFTKLVPRVKDKQVESGYICELRLPINCPLRYVIKSDVMNKKMLAKKSAAFHACVKLHEIKELDDHFLPVGKDNLKYTLESLGFEPYGNEFEGMVKENKDAPRPGTTKRRQYYSKLTADVFTGSAPTNGTKCLLYVFAMRLTCRIPEEQNTRGRRITDPSDTKRSFGILIPNSLPAICDFPVFTRSGEVIVSLERMEQEVTLSDEEIRKICHFHYYTFHDVLHVDKFPMEFDAAKSGTNFFLVPVLFNCTFQDGCWKNLTQSQPDAQIDWNFMQQVRVFDARGEYEPTEEERRNFVFREEVFKDAVIKPWYRQNKAQFFYYVAEICHDQNPRSSFPSLEYESFAAYYEDKYKIKVMTDDQPLLDVDHTSARLNLLTPRYVNRKGITLPMSTAKTKKEKRENSQLKQILIPELVVVHPFPASFWRKTVTLPCILYRLNSLFLAEQLRLKIGREIHAGPVHYDPSFKWPPLDFGWTLAEVLEQQRQEEEAVSNKSDTAAAAAAKKKSSAQPVRSADAASTVSSNGFSGDSQEIGKEELESDFVIDTFDPEKYAIHDDADLDDDLMNDMDLMQIDAMLGLGQPAAGGVFNIGPIPRSAPIGNWDQRRQEKPQPKIIELDDSFDVETNDHTDRETPRIGSPSNFERDEEVNGKEWDQHEEACQFRDIGLELGLAKISVTGGINIESLCEDLVKTPAFDDAYDSDDSIFDDDDEEFGETPARPGDKAAHSGFSSDAKAFKFGDRRNRTEHGNEILINSLIDCTPPGSPGLSDEYLIDNDQSDLKRKLINLLQDNDSPDEGNENVKKLTIREEVDEEEHANEETNFGELLPKHQRDEIQESLDGLTLKFDVYKADVSDRDLGPSPSMILQALTMSNASDGINLERLETVGDSFLKYAVTLFLYCKCENIHEGKLSYLRSRQISNFNLYRLGRRKGLGEYIIASKFEPNDNWLPPGYYIPDGLEGALIDLGSPSLAYDLGELKNMNLGSMTADQVKNEVMKRKDHFLPNSASVTTFNKFSDVDNESLLKVPYNLLTQQSIPDKSIADCVEALIGGYLLYGGAKGALLFMKWLGLKVMPDEEDPAINSDPHDPIWHHLPKVKSPLESFDPNDEEYEQLIAHQKIQLHHLYKGSGLDRFEKEILRYEFRDKSYLVQAFTHNSYFENTITDCYQRLEFLGDAILDFLVTRLLFEDPRKHSPGTLTDLRSALVNNTFFASLAVEYEFHKYLKNLSHDLYRVKSDFVAKFNAKAYRDHCSLYIGEEETENLGDVEVPKALGDIFESVAGAIFLDSGMSLDTVWRVYYRMMKPEIEHFSNNVPKSPIRELLEMEPQNAQFGKPELIPGKKVRVCVEIFGEGSFCGVGRNKRIAKCTAAKRALRVIRPKRKMQSS